MPDVTTLVAGVTSLATRMGTECKTLHGETATNAAAITALESQVATDIATAKSEVKSEILGGASAAYDTLKEIEDLMKTNDGLVEALQAAKFVKYDSQTLTDAEKTQARTNIGAAKEAEVVKFVSQSLSSTEQGVARTNIGAADAADVVTLSSMTLTDTQKSTVRTSIGAASAADVSGLGDGVVRHDESQSLQDANKTQARSNIGAASAADLTALATAIGDLTSIDFVTVFETALNAGSGGSGSGE